MAFQIFTDSCTDLSVKQLKEYNIDYLRMGINVNTKEEYHADLAFEEYSLEQLYNWIKDPNVHIKTSLITFQEVLEKFEPYLKKGIDILYIGCSGALSGSVNSVRLASEELLQDYPERKIIGIDSKRADMALGALCFDACKLRDEGKSLEEVAEWVENNKQFYHEIGSVENLSYLRAMGRVSGPSAFFGNLIGIKPLIMFNRKGENYAFSKVRGMKAALEASVQYIKDNMVPGVTETIYVGSIMGDSYRDYMKEKIEKELGLKVETFPIGTIVGIGVGPGMYGCFFRGKEVKI